MQGANENLTANVPSFDGVPMIPRSLTDPYQQQAHDINQMLQNELKNQLYNQLKLLEQRAEFCILLKDKALKEEKKKNGDLQMSLMTAIAEVGYWKKLTDKKSIEAKEKSLEEEKKKCRETQIRLNKAFSETAYWRMLSDQKMKLCSDLAGRLIEVKKRKDVSRKRNVENNYSEEAYSSTGDNGDDVAETSMNVWRKRPRQ